MSGGSSCPEFGGLFRVSVTRPSAQVAGWFAAILPCAMSLGASLFYFVGGPMDLPFDRALAAVITIPVVLALLASMLCWQGLLRARPILQWPIAALIWAISLVFWRWFMYGP